MDVVIAIEDFISHNVFLKKCKDLSGPFEIIKMEVNIAKQKILRFEYDGDLANCESSLYLKSALFILSFIIMINYFDEF